MQKTKTIFIQLIFGLLLILSTILIIYDSIPTITFAANNFPTFANQPQNISTIQNSAFITPTNCRYGVSSWSNDDFNFLQDLGVGWVLNFSVNFGQNLPDGVEYTPVIRFKPELDETGFRTGNYRVTSKPFTDEPGGLGPFVTANPGRLWLIGNEVDRKYVQDDLMPDVYAMAYHDAYHFIKERDPTAQIAVSGLVEVTPGRLQYLDIVWESYLEKYGNPMPVDVWNMHIYILAEKSPNGGDAEAAIALGTDPALAIKGSGGLSSECSKSNIYCYAEHDDMDIFAQQVVAMRQWMKNHGQQNKPLILSEYSLLFQYEIDSPTSCFLQDEYGNCFTPERVSQFMTNSFDYLETAADTSLGFRADNHRLVQQWLWFPVHVHPDFASNLLKEGYTLTDYEQFVRLPGETFQTKVNSLRPFSTNPFIDQVNYPTATTIAPTGTTSVTIAAIIYNNGDTIATTPSSVTFYADEDKTQEIGAGAISTELAGCARRGEKVEVIWNDLVTGLHPYWAEVNGGNTVKGFVIINPEQTFLPITTR